MTPTTPRDLTFRATRLATIYATGRATKGGDSNRLTFDATIGHTNIGGTYAVTYDPAFDAISNALRREMWK